MPLRQNQHSDFEDALTWQQREDLNAQEPKRRYRARKASKYFLLDAEAATASAEPSALEYGTFVQQTEVKAANTQSRACGKARTRSPPQQSKQAAPPNSIPPPEDLRAVEQKPQSNRKTRKKRKPSVQANMTAEPTGAYVPPHKRNKRLPAAVGLIPKTKTEAKTEPKSKPKTLGKTEPKADVRLGDLEDVIGISTTPPASVKSQLSKPTEDEVFPDGTNPEVYIPPSPPTTEEPPRAPAMLAWDDPKPVENRPLPKRNNPRWPRPTGAPKEKHIWPKAREIPKELSAGSESDGGVTFRSDSGGDPSYDVQKLMNWHGDWLPPPEDWAARKSLTSRHFGQEIEKWASEHGRSCNKVMDIQSPDFIGIKSEHGDWVNKDLVPRYWLHEVIDNSPPREFWKQAPHRAPAPMSDVDATETPPYWERWNHKQPENCFMANLVVPEARIDKDDKENELESPYAMLCVEERIAMVEAIQQEKKRRRHARRNRPVFTAKDEGLSAPDRQLKPKANIYLRPVRPADIPGIMTIYNHYVKDTVHASELEEQTEGQIRVWIDGIVRSGLPCLVAVSKRSQRRGRQGYVMEPIVGFTCLSEFADSSSIFRFSFELETYVHPGYLQQGIGKCLLDQIVFMCNTGYQQRGGYQYAGEYEYLKTGHSRTIKTVVANVHYEKGKEEETEWATSYLGDFGFKKAGRLSQIGHKAGKVISKIIFQMHTTEVIDPLSIPTIQP
ncbi:hypothetical protein E8E12_003043 [Didymella heteroderae]|uniref:N-acetyltransferase domain-containing protein n=1 Tax=Didymella heteroderae TaxID=1769908 RepID=A0A9P4WIM3_9PLEO|nr:hypothetical protein E8E12_003043 [Didymella heteroderae]